MQRRWVVLAVLAGCMADEPTAPEPIQTYGIPLDGTESQGQHLLGANIDNLPSADSNLYSLPASGTLGTNTFSLSVDTGALVAKKGATTLRSTGLKNLRIADGMGTTYRIDNWFPRVGPPDELPERYTVTNVATGAPVCSEYAVFVSDAFSPSREHVVSANRISISCEDGVETKCDKWGYIAGPNPTTDEWKYNQSCARMANFDKCGDGVPGTNEGTYIAMFDAAGVRAPIPTVMKPWRLPNNVWPPPRGQYFIEAKWTPDGAECLSKARWYSMKDTQTCSQLPDPRVAGSGGRFCEDFSDDELTAGGIVLLSASEFNDLPLFNWKSANGDIVSTVRGFPADVRQQYPFDDRTMVPISWTGATILREETAVWTKNLLAPLNMYCAPLAPNATSPHDCTVAATNPGGLTSYGFEGYAFINQPAGTDSTRLYNFTATLPSGATDSLAAPAAPTTDYSRGNRVGWVLQ